MTALPPLSRTLLPPVPAPSSIPPDTIIPIPTTSTATAPPSPPTSDSEVDTHHSSDPTCLSSRPVRTLLLFTLVTVFSVSLTFGVRSWIRYERDLSDLRWEAHRCTIRSKSIASNPTVPTHYRVEAFVTGAPPLTDQPRLAFSGSSGVYLLSRLEAERQLAGVVTGSADCWVKRSNASAISIEEVSSTEEERMSVKGSLYVAWTMTFVAAFVGMLTVTLASHWMHEFLVRVMGGAEEGEGRKVRVGLSRDQARWVCDSLGDLVKGREEGVGDWVCSICLDEDDKGGLVSTVVLPCGHRFHRECIRKWLRRGRAACPLCHWDAKSLFDAAGNPRPDALKETRREAGDDGRTDGEEGEARDRSIAEEV